MLAMAGTAIGAFGLTLNCADDSVAPASGPELHGRECHSMVQRLSLRLLLRGMARLLKSLRPLHSGLILAREDACPTNLHRF